MIYFLALLILVVAPVLVITEVARVAINGDKKRK